MTFQRHISHSYDLVWTWHDVQKMSEIINEWINKDLIELIPHSFWKCSDPTLRADSLPCIIIPAKIVKCF